MMAEGAMPGTTWLTYVAAVLVLMSTPGSSHLLMLSSAMANGFRRSLATASGDLSANVLQMLAASIGLGALVQASESVFTLIKWLGVAYLIWMGTSRMRTAGAEPSLEPVGTPAPALWLQGFVTSAANPKAVLFFAALFPQFLSPDGPFWGQVSVLGATYLALDGTFLMAYGGGATWIASRLNGQTRAWLDRLSGGLLVATGILLGWRPASR